jgi:putative ABC transport system permease protein
MTQNLRHAIRRLRAQPGTALLSVALLALAIGLTSATFTLIDALMLRPAPFRDPSTLARLGLGENAQSASVNIPTTLIKAWRSAEGFSAVHAVLQQPASFGTGEAQERVSGAFVTRGLIEELGAAPMLGRTFLSDEGGPGRDDVALISERLWRSRFGADPALVGTRVEMSGAQVLIAGVMPASFAFPFSQTRVWRPMDLDRPAGAAARPNVRGYAYVRVAPGVPREDAARMATVIADAVAPATADRRVFLRAISDGYLDTYSADTLRAGAAGVALVFFVLCVNVLNLTLSTLATRRREFAVCSVLGASRGRLLKQALWEQMLIGIGAAGVGLAAGAGLVALARTLLPVSILSRTLNPIDLDLRAVAAASVFSLLAVIAAGLIPAWIGTRPDGAPELQLLSRVATADRKSRRLVMGMLVGELALAVALCVGAGIQLRSFVNLLHEDRGFDADRLSTFEVSLPAPQFADGPSRYVAAEHLRATAAALTGIDGVALSYGSPPSRGILHFYDVRPDTPGAAPVKLEMNGYVVSPEFFQVFGVRILQGRALRAGDPPGTVLVSQSMAAALWPGESAVDRAFTFSNSRAFRVAGVTAEIRNPTLDPRQDQPEIYEPLFGDKGGTTASLGSASLDLTVRCGTVCPSLETVRAQLRAASPAALVYAGKYLRDDYAVALERPRAGSVIAIAFAGIGLLAVGAGLFAVLTRVAQQRQREFGIRLALGATPAALGRIVHATGLWIAAAGIASGVVLAVALGRALTAVQYQVDLTDSTTWTIVVAAMAATVFAASWRPARQASRVDPIVLLREE